MTKPASKQRDKHKGST